MPATLLTPSATITTSSYGVKIVRLSDYIGPTRGTLTTVSDSKSLSGSVIKDTQMRSVATSTATTANSFYTSSSDSVRIPVGDIGFNNDWGYLLYIGMRMTGEAPSNAQMGNSWFRYPAASRSAGVGSGYDTTLISRGDVYRDMFEEYKIVSVGEIFPGFTSFTNLVLRAWGIAGGDVEIYLDVLYAVPNEGVNGEWNFWDFLEYAVEGYNPLGFSTNGTYFPSGIAPQDSSSTWMGNHSVIFPNHFAGTGRNTFSVADLQESNIEPTALDITQNLWDGSGNTPFDDDDPETYLASVGVGSLYVPSHTIVDHSFPNNEVVVSTARYYLTPNNMWWSLNGAGNNFGGLYGGTTLPGWHAHATGQAQCLIPANQAFGGGTDPDKRARATMALGITSDPNSTSDPRNYKPLPSDVWSYVATCKARIEKLVPVEFWIGHCHDTGLNDSTGAVVDLTSGGAITLKLKKWTTTTTLQSSTFALASMGTYTANTYFWIKVQRRGYLWRAKFWLDGDTEPSTWNIEGNEPQSYRNSAGTNRGFITYPWDVSWDDDLVNHDIIVDDVRSNDLSYPMIRANVQDSQVELLVEFDNYKLEWDSDGTNPGDMVISTEKYDATTTYDTITVPYGSQRVIDWGRQTRHYNNDSHGFNIRAYKISGPNLQLPSLGDLFERRSHDRILDLIRIRFRAFSPDGEA